MRECGVREFGENSKGIRTKIWVDPDVVRNVNGILHSGENENVAGSNSDVTADGTAVESAASRRTRIRQALVWGLDKWVSNHEKTAADRHLLRDAVRCMQQQASLNSGRIAGE